MKPYIPESLPLKNLNYELLFSFLGEASSELARYDGLLQGIPNPTILLSPLTTKEAVLSSKIEGTQATMDEVLEQEAGMLKEGEKLKDIQEISNYRLALMRASEYMKDYPIRLGLVRELHKILLNSVRGEKKEPGEFRRDQNWIGKPGSPIERATFVPPDPLHLRDFLNEWEKYLDFNDSNFLLQAAVVHAQFELIHPFKDGNGRIGRILIPLFLYQKKQLSQPMFYLSEYLENHREEYYIRLREISQNNDWNGWISFFMQAVAVQAKENSFKVKLIMKLYEDMKMKIQEITHSQYSVKLLDAIFNRPIFETASLVNQSGINKKTAMSLLKTIRDHNILTLLREASGRKPAVYCFPELLKITEGGYRTT
jgi:Fic family protein